MAVGLVAGTVPAGPVVASGEPRDVRAAAVETGTDVLPGIMPVDPGPRSGIFRPAETPYGLRLPAGEEQPPAVAGTWLAGEGEGPSRVVLLVHGLDDPGWVFKDLLGPLRAAGHEPVELIYPNDGPIAASADRLATSLASLRDLGVERVDIVAHSMGGLVTRDVLTRAEYYDGDARGGERYPAVEHFVMCGTPNLGSRAARIRWLAEAREHLTRSLSGRGHLLGGLRDGRGEAGRDLLPDSAFLADLNDRGLPEHVAITCVVAHASPVAPEGADRAAAAVRRTLGDVRGPRWWRRFVGGVGNVIAAGIDGSVDGLGDGVVSIASACLPGVSDVVIVTGNHASMLARLLPFGDELPPAAAVVLDRLRREAVTAASDVPAANAAP